MHLFAVRPYSVDDMITDQQGEFVIDVDVPHGQVNRNPELEKTAGCLAPAVAGDHLARPQDTHRTGLEEPVDGVQIARVEVADEHGRKLSGVGDEAILLLYSHDPS